MAAKSIVEVEIKDGQFREFYALFNQYQKKLGEMPDDWKKVVDTIGDAGDGMDDFAKSSSHSKESLMVAAIQADAIGKAVQRAIGAQDKLNTKTKDGAIQMGRMAKFSKEMHKDFSKMSSILLKVGALGGTAMAIPGAILASTNAVANQNLQARGLGLRIGQTQAFNANFERFGLGTSDLSNVANAQSDVSKWRAFLAAGLTPQQIQNEDAEQLTYDFARAASGKYRAWQKAGLPAATMAQAYGFTDILSQQQLRTGASYEDSKFVSAQAKTLADAKANEINQGVADQASDVKAALQSDWAKVLNEFNGQLAQAAPALKTLGDNAAAAAITLLKVAGPQAKSLVDAMANGAPPSVLKEGLHPTLSKPNDLGSGFAGIGYAIRDLFGMNSKVGTPTDALGSMLDAQYSIESARGKNLKSPKGALGPMQFMPATWKEWGHGDVNNLHDSMEAANRYDTFLLKRYSGDVRAALAAYNWGMGNVDKDIATHGDKWEQYAPRETQQYIDKIVRLMARGGQNVNININNSTPARVAVSQNAAQY